MTVGNFLLEVLGGVGGGGIFTAVVLRGYLVEKAKNLATRQDISEITRRVEEVKLGFSRYLEDIRAQNALTLEQHSHENRLRMAALDKRLQVHQEAFSLWRGLMKDLHFPERLRDHVLKCQSWFEQNCLYLTPRSRTSFSDAYWTAANHYNIPRGLEFQRQWSESFDKINICGDILLEEVSIPPLVDREALRVEDADRREAGGA